MKPPRLAKSTVIGILAQEFLINIGANDFLKNLIRGLDLIENLDLIFICPPDSTSSSTNNLRHHDSSYEDELKERFKFYSAACRHMRFIASSSDSISLFKLQNNIGIDFYFPSIHVLTHPLQYITYWPDCQPKHFPQFFDDESQKVRDSMIKGLLDSGMPMIINSAAAKQDMIRYYSAYPRQIHSLPFAPVIEFDAFIPRPELIAGYNLPQNYFLVCNQFWIHKSIETVLEAIRLGLDKGRPFHVVFTGKMEEPRRPEYIQWIMDIVDRLEISDYTTFLGYIPKADQIEIMKWSISVIQPTLFEGGPGGGSVYDAISIGTRAIVTDIPVNRELCQDTTQVSYFPPRDHHKLYESMLRFADEKWIHPCSEDLYQQSKKSCLALAYSLLNAINSLKLK